MMPEKKARALIDARLEQSGWVVQDLNKVNPMASLGVAVREYPTSTGPVDYALFVDGKPVGVIEAKKDELGENITVVEGQSGRYANSTFKYITTEYKIRFAYEATGQLTRFTDYADIKYRSRRVFTFHRPETLLALLVKDDTIRNSMKRLPAFDSTGFRKCQITAIQNLDASFADNRPKALVQMATGAGKTFTAITAAYRLLKFGKMKRINPLITWFFALQIICRIKFADICQSFKHQLVGVNAVGEAGDVVEAGEGDNLPAGDGAFEEEGRVARPGDELGGGESGGTGANDSEIFHKRGL